MTMRKTASLFHWMTTPPISIACRARDEGRDGLEVDAVDRERDVLDDERDADGGDERGEAGRRAQRLVRDALDGRVDDGEERDRDRERHQQADDDEDHALVRVEVEDRDDHRAGDEPGEREDVAVREVDQLEDPVDERVAERDEPVDGAVRRSDDRDVEEARRVLEELQERGRAGPRRPAPGRSGRPGSTTGRVGAPLPPWPSRDSNQRRGGRAMPSRLSFVAVRRRRLRAAPPSPSRASARSCPPSRACRWPRTS